MRRISILSFLFSCVPVACSSGGLQVGRDLRVVVDGGGDGAEAAVGACQASGGSCVLGNVTCSKQAPATAQDCGPADNPGGTFCCLSSTPEDAGATSACETAGGSCVLGNVSCAKQAPASDQDCNPDRNPGGAFCCLESSEDAGTPSACESAGGSCVLGNVSCARQAPASDQDCNPEDNPGGAFCCLPNPGDAGTTSACKSVGGSCVLGDVPCATEAPAADQDCNPDKNPGGAFCCLDP